MTELEIYKAIESKYGLNAMKLVWLEELHELTTVILQSMRERDTRRKVRNIHIMNEISDVEICISQMKNRLFTGEECHQIDRMREFTIQGLPEKLKL